MTAFTFAFTIQHLWDRYQRQLTGAWKCISMLMVSHVSSPEGQIVCHGFGPLSLEAMLEICGWEFATYAPMHPYQLY
jgi:hypothetical protein